MPRPKSSERAERRRNTEDVAEQAEATLLLMGDVIEQVRLSEEI